MKIIQQETFPRQITCFFPSPWLNFRVDSMAAESTFLNFSWITHWKWNADCSSHAFTINRAELWEKQGGKVKWQCKPQHLGTNLPSFLPGRSAVKCQGSEGRPRGLAGVTGDFVKGARFAGAPMPLSRLLAPGEMAAISRCKFLPCRSAPVASPFPRALHTRAAYSGGPETFNRCSFIPVWRRTGGSSELFWGRSLSNQEVTAAWP